MNSFDFIWDYEKGIIQKIVLEKPENETNKPYTLQFVGELRSSHNYKMVPIENYSRQ